MFEVKRSRKMDHLESLESQSVIFYLVVVDTQNGTYKVMF